MATQETPGEMLERLRKVEAEREAETKDRIAKLQAETESKRAASEKAAADAAKANEAQRQAEAAAAFDAKFKTPALDAWIADGGSTADFERHWKDEGAKIRMAEVQRGIADARERMRRAFYQQL